MAQSGNFIETMSSPNTTGLDQGTKAAPGLGAAVGAGLEGLSGLVSMGLKASAENRVQNLTTEIQSNLFPDIKAYAGQPDPKGSIVGTAPSATQAAAEATPGYASLQSDGNRWKQATIQGGMSQAEFTARVSQKVQDEIARNPRYADEIRTAAQNILGFKPTAAMSAIETKTQDEEQARQMAWQTDQVTKAVQSGIVYFKNDDPRQGIDVARTSAEGITLNKAEYDLKNVGNQLTIDEQKVRLATSISPPLTQDQIISNESRSAVKAYNPVYESQVNANIASLSATLEANKNLPPDQQSQILQSSVGALRLKFMNGLNTSFNQMDHPLDPKSIENVRKYYSDQFDVWAEWAKGDLSQFATKTRQLQAMGTQANLDLAQTSPVLARLHMVFGGAANGSIDTALLAGSQLSNSVQTGVNDFLNNTGPNAVTIGKAATNAVTGGPTLDGIQDPVMQRAALGVLRTANKHYAEHSNELTDEELHTFGESAANVVTLGLQTNDAQELKFAAGDVSTLQYANLLDRYASQPANADKAQALGAGALELNHKAITSNIPLLKPVTVSGPSGQSAGIPESYAQGISTYRVTPQYNPQTGQVQLQVTDENFSPVSRQDQIRNGVNIPKTLQESVNQVNKSLNISSRLQKYSVSPETQKADNLLLRQTWIAESGGMQLAPGSALIKPPKSSQEGDTAALPSSLHIAQQGVESNNNANAVSPKGAEGLMQTLPGTETDPGFGVTPAKDNSSEEKARVGRDYSDALIRKYHGNESLGLAAYNWGPGNVDAWLKAGGDWSKVPQETKDYVSKVLMKRALIDIKG